MDKNESEWQAYYEILFRKIFQSIPEISNFHKKTVASAVEIMAAAGLHHPDLVSRKIIYRRVDATKIETYEETYPEMIEGCLLHKDSVPSKYINDWNLASQDKF